MADAYVSEYTQAEMDACVSKMMKNGKGKRQANQMCKMSLSNRKKPVQKEKPYKIVSSAGNEAHYIFSSTSKIDTSSEGTLVKGIEIFKAGMFKGIDFQQSALEKMVSNFHFLKDHGVFPNVPVRADHPSFFEGGSVNKIGGYVADLKIIGTKLVADIRVTSTDMLNKIKEGTYISRSSEIGSYEDNKGNIFSPILYGFAFVDIPAVEGLSPKFSFSKDKKVQLINLNQENIMGDEIKEEFPATEEVVETPEGETPAEVVAEAVVEPAAEVVAEPKVEVIQEAKEVSVVEFAKAFPAEAAELEKFKSEQFNVYVESLVSAGKIAPATKEVEVAFVRSLSAEQFAKYKEIKEKTPAFIKFDAEPKEEAVIPPVAEENKTPAEKAAEFVEKTN